MIRAIALIDGEHYAPVVRDALAWLLARKHSMHQNRDSKPVPSTYPYQSMGWRMQLAIKERNAARSEW